MHSRLHSTMHSRRKSEAGFTLVEILIALSAFALIALGGTALINIALVSQDRLERASEQTRGLQRLQAVLRADFGQMVERQSRGEDGAFMPGLSLNSDDALIEFARLGRLPDPDQPRPTLEKVRYSLSRGTLYRTRFSHTDGSAPNRPAALIEGVLSAKVRVFRRGTWGEADAAADLFLPEAVEVHLRHRDYGDIRLKYLAPGSADPLAQQAL